MTPLLAGACSASLQVFSPSAQVKAAAAQVVDLNWDGEGKNLIAYHRDIQPYRVLLGCVGSIIVAEDFFAVFSSSQLFRGRCHLAGSDLSREIESWLTL
jgi:hypothetical protein